MGGIAKLRGKLGGCRRERGGARKLAKRSCGSPRAERRLPAGKRDYVLVSDEKFQADLVSIDCHKTNCNG